MNPKELLEKLPLVRGWIDRTLAEHSNRAQPSRVLSLSPAWRFLFQRIFDDGEGG